MLISRIACRSSRAACLLLKRGADRKISLSEVFMNKITLVCILMAGLCDNIVHAANPVSTATNLLVDALGIPARFVAPDRGEPIPVLVDADYLPAGITLT